MLSVSLLIRVENSQTKLKSESWPLRKNSADGVLSGPSALGRWCGERAPDAGRFLLVGRDEGALRGLLRFLGSITCADGVCSDSTIVRVCGRGRTPLPKDSRGQGYDSSNRRLGSGLQTQPRVEVPAAHARPCPGTGCPRPHPVLRAVSCLPGSLQDRFFPRLLDEKSPPECVRRQSCACMCVYLLKSCWRFCFIWFRG